MRWLRSSPYREVSANWFCHTLKTTPFVLRMVVEIRGIVQQWMIFLSDDGLHLLAVSDVSIFCSQRRNQDRPFR